MRVKTSSMFGRWARGVTVATLLVVPASASAATAANPYMGDPVPQATSATTGALMSAGLAAGRGAPGAGRLVTVRPGVWVLRNFSIVNCTFVDTPKGIVVFDTGTTFGQGDAFLAEIRKVTSKPIIAIIYSHSHYTRGAAAMVKGSGPVEIIGHPLVEKNLEARSLAMQPSYMRRANMQFGAYLPASGPDAGIAPPAPKADDPAKMANGHLKVTHPVADGERIDIGGMEFQFFHAQGDTNDTLTVWIPAYSTVLTNVTSQYYFALYTLRGEAFRPPQAVIDSYDTIRHLKPAYYVPSHGDVVEGQDAVVARMTAHRDAYSFTFNQAIRGINRGWGPDELVANIHLPEHLANDPSLYQAYSEFTFALRGIYRGLLGWYGEDAADMHPPAPKVLGASIVEGFGGMNALLARVRAEQSRRHYALAAKLASYGVAAEPQNMAIRQAEADALRSMARVAYGSQSYNFLLVEARHLEGKQDKFQPVAGEFAKSNYEALAGQPPRLLVSVLESRIAAERTQSIVDHLRVTFTDVSQSFDVDVRRGVAEVRPADGASAPELKLDRKTWFSIIEGTTRVADAVAQGRATLAGASPDRAATFLAYFDPL